MRIRHFRPDHATQLASPRHTPLLGALKTVWALPLQTTAGEGILDPNVLDLLRFIHVIGFTEKRVLGDTITPDERQLHMLSVGRNKAMHNGRAAV